VGRAGLFNLFASFKAVGEPCMTSNSHDAPLVIRVGGQTLQVPHEWCLISVKNQILQQCQQGDFSWGRAGLFNLFASFKAVGEPAPTGPTRMVQDVS
jgi:hypothetical protein